MSQAGIRFNLLQVVMEGVGTDSDWVLQRHQTITNGNHTVEELSCQAARLFDHYKAGDCIELYFVGMVEPNAVAAFHHKCGIAIPRGSNRPMVVAHELGHALGLVDCYARNKVGVMIAGNGTAVARGMFSTDGRDWGDETSHGFYGYADTVEKMLHSMLMCGELDGWGFGTDIPDDWIESLESHTLLSTQTIHAPVGARTVESKTDAEIYSK